MLSGSLNRRGFFVLVGAAAGAMMLARSTSRDSAPASSSPSTGASTPPAPQASASPSSSALGLAPGDSIAGGWTVSAIHPVTLGAIPVILEGAHGKFQLDVLRRAENGPSGIGNSERLSVFLCNQGDGGKRTHEDHGLAAMALAEQLKAREASLDLSGLLTLEERQAQHRGGAFVVLS